MPHIKLIGRKFLILPDEDTNSHTNKWALDLGALSCAESFTDVTFHCKNKTALKANKLVLAHSSGLLRSIFQTGCDLSPYVPVTYDLLCPGFDPQAIKKILEILYTGETYLDMGDLNLYYEMISVLQALQISMALPNLASLNPNTSDLDTSDDCLEIGVTIKQEKIHESDPFYENEINGFSLLSPSLEVANFACTICDKEYPSEQWLESHLKTHTAANVDDPGLELTLSNTCLNESMETEQIPAMMECNNTSAKKELAKEKTNGNKSFKCPECTAEIQHYYNLICHIATAHYKDQLKKMQGSENRKCTLCSDMFNSKRQLIRHLIFKHSALKNKIPSREECEIFRSSNDAIANKSIKQNKMDTVLTTESYVSESNKKEVLIFKCHICDAKYQKLYNLRTHLSVSHFKNNLKKHYGEKEWSCNLCKKEFKIERILLSHIANTHQALKSLMPDKESLRVKTSPKANNNRSLSKKAKVYAGSNSGTKMNSTKDKDSINSKSQENNKDLQDMTCTSMKDIRREEKERRHRSRIEIKSKQKYNCSKCSTVCKKYPDLRKHIALQHHKIELSKMYAEEKWNCGLCSKPFASECGLVYHLIASHNALKEFIPEKESFSDVPKIHKIVENVELGDIVKQAVCDPFAS